MAILAKAFSGSGEEYTSSAIAHAGGVMQLCVFGDPTSGGVDCKLTILKEVVSPVSNYLEIEHPISSGINRIALEACNIKIRVSQQREGADFAFELTTL